MFYVCTCVALYGLTVKETHPWLMDSWFYSFTLLTFNYHILLLSVLTYNSCDNLTLDEYCVNSFELNTNGMWITFHLVGHGICMDVTWLNIYLVGCELNEYHIKGHCYFWKWLYYIKCHFLKSVTSECEMINYIVKFCYSKSVYRLICYQQGNIKGK